MRVHVADHPLIAHKLTYLRHKGTDSPTFRRLADELVTLLAYEATREVRTEPFDIETPVSATTGIKLSTPKPLVVPILRAGLGMLEGMVRLLPTAEVGFLGMLRNEETLEALTYAKEAADALVVGPADAKGVDLGPVISEQQFDKIQRLIGVGIEEGATLVAGGLGRPEGLKDGYFVRPTVFGNVTPNMTIAREEMNSPTMFSPMPMTKPPTTAPGKSAFRPMA